jgi:hypothetical protein
MKELYLAGLFDGEGCITIKKTKPRSGGVSICYTLAICIEMADPRPIKLFCDFFGIKMTYNNTRNRKNPEKHRFLYVAYAGSKKAFYILDRLEPYLVAKREEAIVALDFYNKCYRTQSKHAVGRARKPNPKWLMDMRHNYYLNLQKLKRRDFPPPLKQKT